MKHSIVAGIVTVISIIVIIIAVAVIGFVVRCNILPSGRCTVDEDLSDNSYNNTNLASDELVLLNNKLYYNFYGGDTDFQYGTYEIDKDGSRRVQYHGYAIKHPGLDVFEAFKGKLLLDEITTTGSIHIYNPDTQSEQSYATLKNAKKNRYQTYDVINGRMYIFSEDKIFVSDDAENTEVVFDNLDDIAKNSLDEKLLYIKGDIIAYVSKDESVKEYNFKTKKYVFNKKLELDYNGVEDLFVYIDNVLIIDDDIIISATDESKQCIYNITEKNKIIYSLDYSESGRNPNDYINVYKNQIYVLDVNDGLDCVDVGTSKVRKIVKDEVQDVYIFGDKWVYYVLDKGGKLYRTTHDGKITEKIFG